MYKVFGYDDMCSDFEYSYDSFVKACRAFMQLDREGLNVVFITGVSRAVEYKMKYEY